MRLPFRSQSHSITAGTQEGKTVENSPSKRNYSCNYAPIFQNEFENRCRANERVLKTLFGALNICYFTLGILFSSSYFFKLRCLNRAHTIMCTCFFMPVQRQPVSIYLV